MSKKRIRQYYEDYIKWFPERWEWNLVDERGNRELYMKFRARRSSSYTDNDRRPFFDSIEKDANQFGLTYVEFTDIFGIKWKGTKGVNRYVGAPDYEGHMYYSSIDPNDECDDEWCVSDEVTVDKVPDGYAMINSHCGKEYIDMEDVVDVNYNYIVENHLFKDSSVTISYDGPIVNADEWGDDKDIIRVWDIECVAKALKHFKPDLYKKFLAQVDEHFKELQASTEENREYAPTNKDGTYMTAAEYFDAIEKES